MNIKLLNDQVQQVTLWNQVAQNMSEDFSNNKAIDQAGYVIEEAKETIDAILEKNDEQHLDGVGDIFVTLTYLYRVISKENLEFTDEMFIGFGGAVEGFDLRYANMAVASAVIGIVDMVERQVYHSEDEDAVLMNIADLMVELLFNVKEIYNIEPTDVIQKVLDSNWSKYVKRDQLDPMDVVHECNWIEGAYNVTDVSAVYSGDYIVFRDKNGKGKIRKPSSYKEPAKFL